MKQELINLFKLFIDYKQPYFWGIMAAMNIVIGALLGINFLLYPIILCFGIGFLQVIFYLGQSTIEKSKATGKWEGQAMFLSFILLCMVLYYFF